MTRIVWMVSLILFATPVLATNWYSVAADSKLEFVATFEEAPVSGEFKTFDAHLHGFEPGAAGGSLEVVIAVSSADMGIADVNEAIQDKKWFDFAAHPQARFRATEVTRQGDGYVARGALTLKGVEKAVEVRFAWTPSGDGAIASGEFTVKRGDFGIGTGDWATTDTIGADVTVRFKVRMVASD
jgi:polyisoprenoid-binding protein YceI